MESKRSSGISYVAKKYPYTTLMTWEFYEHRHSFFEIIVCIGGSSEQMINDKRYGFSAGDIIVMKPGSVHDYKIADKEPYAHYDLYASAEDVKTACLGLPSDFFKHITGTIEPLTLSVSKPMTDALKEKFEQLNSVQQHAGMTALSDTVYRTLLRIILGLAHEHTLTTSAEVPEWFSHIISLMGSSEHIGESVSDIVSSSGFSHGHLSRLFKAYTGTTLNAYFTEIKMDYATMLLKNKNVSILDVSAYLGYNSLSHFIQIFKRYNGISPKQYRKRLYGNR